METQNEPPTLSEAHALTLLQQHCSVLHRRLVFDASRDHGAHATQKWMALLCVNVTASELRAGLGYELRVAIDIVNALCACRGFSPHLNGRFWRDVVSTLWIEYPADPFSDSDSDDGLPGFGDIFKPPTNYMFPLDSEAFTCFTVSMPIYQPNEFDTALLGELWRQVAWTDVSAKCPRALVESRERVLHELRMYAVRGVRTLKLELALPSNAEFPQFNYNRRLPPPSEWHWQPLYDAAHEPAPVRQLTSSSIQCLRLDAVFFETNASATERQLVMFGELLYTLLIERHSLETLKLEGQRRQHLIAATCSLLPMVSCLQELEVVDVDDGEDASWLSYGLRHPLRTHDLSRLTVLFKLLAIGKPTKSLAVWTSQTPLRVVARKAVDAAAASLRRSRVLHNAYKWFAMGTTFAHVLRPTAELFVDPAWVQRAWKPVKQGAKLEVVVVVEVMDAVGVVVHGWGLCWMKSEAVRLETTAGGGGGQQLHRINSLCLVSAPVELPVLLLNRVVDGASLVSLDLQCWGRIQSPKNDLAPLLACCPNLKCLSLESCRIASVKPLVRVYASSVQPCRIASLRLTFYGKRRRAAKELDRLFNMLADCEHPGACVLHHLSVTLPIAHRTVVEQTASLLVVNSTLETVSIFGRDGVGRDGRDLVRLDAWTQETLSPFQDQVLCDARAYCVALLSVVREHSDTGETLAAMDVLVVKTVMAFVGPTRVRTVRWLCGPDDCFPSLASY